MKLKNILWLSAVLFLAHGKLNAQNDALKNFMDSLAKRSPLLEHAQAFLYWQDEKAQLKLFPSDPTIAYAYLRGPGGVGKNTELQITQDFDFPTAYINKSEISKKERQLAAVEYQYRSKLVKKEVFQLIVERNRQVGYTLIYNQLRLDSEQAKTAVDKLFRLGAKNQLEVVAAERLQVRAQAQYEQRLLSLQQLDERLSWMLGITANAGSIGEWGTKTIALTQTINPLDYSAEQSVQVQVQAKKLELAKQQVSLARSSYAPNLSMGYKQTVGDGTAFKGLIVGMSIPIFESQHQLKTAKRARYLEESAYKNEQSESFITLKRLQDNWKSILLQESRMKAFLNQNKTEILLMKSLEAGQMSVLDWIREREKCLDDSLTLTDLQAQKLNIIGSLFLWQ